MRVLPGTDKKVAAVLRKMAEKRTAPVERPVKGADGKWRMGGKFCKPPKS